MNRRRFLANTPLALAGLRSALLAQTASARTTLGVRIDDVIAHVAKDCMGLSYESTQLGEPEFFSAANSKLVALFRTLSPQGVLRLGGNTSEFTWFQPDAHAQVPVYQPKPTQPAALVAITPRSLHNLNGFLQATGWSCIYGLNLGTATPERVAEEAAAVSRIVGTRLKYLQIGNEPNNYIRYKLRPPSWSAQAYLDEWLPFAKAIVQRVPDARIGGPDMGADREWMELFAKVVPGELGASLVEMTDHFYAEGPPSSPQATIANLFSREKIGQEIAVMQDAGRVSQRPYRMTEVNSCYLGGKPGVSNSMGSALWAADLTLQLAVAGFSGINFHGGSAKQIKSSLGGTMPGDAVANAEAADSYYTPIAGTEDSGYKARPIFYGMMLAARFAGCELVKIDGAPEPLRAYAAVDNGRDALLVALIHPGENTLPLRLQAGGRFRQALRQDLLAPELSSTTDITLGGAHIGPLGRLERERSERVLVSAEGGVELIVSPHSATLLTFVRR